MADNETGHRWWIRYVVVPIVVVILAALLQTVRPATKESPTAPQVTAQERDAKDSVPTRRDSVPTRRGPDTAPTTTPASSLSQLEIIGGLAVILMFWAATLFVILRSEVRILFSRPSLNVAGTWTGKGRDLHGFGTVDAFRPRCL